MSKRGKTRNNSGGEGSEGKGDGDKSKEKETLVISKRNMRARSRSPRESDGDADTTPGSSKRSSRSMMTRSAAALIPPGFLARDLNQMSSTIPNEILYDTTDDVYPKASGWKEWDSGILSIFHERSSLGLTPLDRTQWDKAMDTLIGLRRSYLETQRTGRFASKEMATLQSNQATEDATSAEILHWKAKYSEMVNDRDALKMRLESLEANLDQVREVTASTSAPTRSSFTFGEIQNGEVSNSSFGQTRMSQPISGSMSHEMAVMTMQNIKLEIEDNSYEDILNSPVSEFGSECNDEDEENLNRRVAVANMKSQNIEEEDLPDQTEQPLVNGANRKGYRFFCPNCGYGFHAHVHLRRHLAPPAYRGNRIVKPIGTKCPVCDKELNASKCLKVHLKMKHPGVRMANKRVIQATRKVDALKTADTNEGTQQPEANIEPEAGPSIRSRQPTATSKPKRVLRKRPKTMKKVEKKEETKKDPKPTDKSTKGPFPCGYCGHKFRQLYQLDAHWTQTKGVVRTKANTTCSFCKKAFLTTKCMKLHVWYQHPELKPKKTGSSSGKA